MCVCYVNIYSMGTSSYLHINATTHSYITWSRTGTGIRIVFNANDLDLLSFYEFGARASVPRCAYYLQ